jgi:hypothetical protein
MLTVYCTFQPLGGAEAIPQLYLSNARWRDWEGSRAKGVLQDTGKGTTVIGDRICGHRDYLYPELQFFFFFSVHFPLLSW